MCPWPVEGWLGFLTSELPRQWPISLVPLSLSLIFCQESLCEFSSWWLGGNVSGSSQAWAKNGQSIPYTVLSWPNKSQGPPRIKCVEKDPSYHERSCGGIFARGIPWQWLFIRSPPCYSALLGGFSKNTSGGVWGSSRHTDVWCLCPHLLSYKKKPKAGTRHSQTLLAHSNRGTEQGSDTVRPFWHTAIG